MATKARVPERDRQSDRLRSFCALVKSIGIPPTQHTECTRLALCNAIAHTPIPLTTAVSLSKTQANYHRTTGDTRYLIPTQVGPDDDPKELK